MTRSRVTSIRLTDDDLDRADALIRSFSRRDRGGNPLSTNTLNAVIRLALQRLADAERPHDPEWSAAADEFSDDFDYALRERMDREASREWMRQFRAWKDGRGPRPGPPPGTPPPPGMGDD